MQFLKSITEGIGTAAGFSLPTYGILVGVLSLCVASTTSIILSTIFSALFVVTAVPVAYWSYKDYLKEKQKLREMLATSIDNECQMLINYLVRAINECLETEGDEITNECLLEQLKIKIQEDFSDIAPKSIAIKPFLLFFLNQTDMLQILEQINPAMPASIYLQETFSKISTAYYAQNQRDIHWGPHIKKGVIGFTAVYGSIVGCSAGTLGMLQSIGLFAGLAAVPIVGWTVLGVGGILAISVAAFCIYSSYQKNLINNSIEYHKSNSKGIKPVLSSKEIHHQERPSRQRNHEQEFSASPINIPIQNFLGSVIPVSNYSSYPETKKLLPDDEEIYTQSVTCSL